MIDLTTATARAVAALVRDRQITAVEVTRTALARVEKYDPALRAFIAVNPGAAKEAEQVDRDVAAGRLLPLAGVPLAVKDSFHVKGLRTTGGSKALGQDVADRDAAAVARLRAAGCVVIGKTSMHELAFGFTNRNRHFGDCKNPWDPGRIPGGSSGGNAVALAASMALAALGGDTGGSIRMPAALCGVAGLKVTYGRVSRAGGLPLSWSMDTVGPMARDVGDLAALLQAMAGPDPDDPAAVRGPVPDYAEALVGADLQGVRVGVPHNHFFEALEPDVATAAHDALEVLKGLGATLVDVAFPSLEPVRGAHRTILFSEAAAAHRGLAGTPAAELDPETLRLLRAGHFFSAPQYLAAQQARRHVIADYRKLWKGFDLLVTPTSPVAATELEATSVKLGGEDRPLLGVYLDHTLPFNLTGQPAVSIPCGFTGAGLPVGLQLAGRPFDEPLLLRAAAMYQKATTWHTKRPPLDRLKTN
jgi:aspartyl-tRNA(Asn)/glutamyl-tRNA(Gln) amidotransferase subunit A